MFGSSCARFPPHNTSVDLRNRTVVFGVDCGGITILLDPSSAQRADGVSIDFVTGPEGSGLDRNTTVVFQCHHGIRSQSAAEYCLREGFRNLYNLQGGIDAWSQLVDPSVPRY
jgi:rhodanese-related sulfurtransferase